MLSRLSVADRLLLGLLLPACLVCVALHLHEVHRSGLAQLPVYAVPGWDGSSYPRVGGFRIETGHRGSDLALGDRLLRVGERDLRGAGYIGFDAVGLAEAGAHGEARLVYERAGVQRETSLRAEARPYPWSRVPSLLLFIVVCVLILLRAPGSRDAQRFFVAFVTYGLVQSQFYGGPEWQTRASLWIWNLGTPIAALLMLRWARLFPEELPEAQRAWWGWPWLAGLAYAGVRLNYNLGAPLPAQLVPALSFASHGLLMLGTLALLTHNYMHASPVGRRRIKWVVYGGFVGVAPLFAVQLSPLLAPGWSGFAPAFALSLLASILTLACVLVAIVRYNAFDVDRLIGATAAYSLVAAAFVGTLLAGVPPLAQVVSRRLGTSAGTVQLALAMLLAAGVVPVGRRLRPLVDRVFFPERIALQRGVEDLLRELSRGATPGEVLERTAAGVAALLRPQAWALFVREGGHLAHRVGAPLAPPREVAEREGPRAQPDGSLELPIHVGGDLRALVVLGPKRSGDVYTPTDRALLAAVADKAAGELRRFRFAEAMRRDRERVAALRSQKQEADEANLAKSRLLAAASHDIRQPLHALGFLVESLRGRLGTPDAADLVEKIQRSSDDLAEMLSAILDVSRAESGALRTEVSDVALGPLLEQLAGELGPQARARGLALRAVPSRAVVRSDRVLLTRILRNLASNALRYTERGGVLIGCRRRGERVCIEVVDTGPGIPAAQLGEAFAEYRRLDSSRDGEGAGLGLAIVRRLADLLGHELEVRSQPGRGSCFGVLVPRARPQAVPAGRDAHEAPSGIAAVDRLVGRRVAVVDDDAAVRAATAELLASWGCEVRTAASAAEARERLAPPAWSPDVVLADQHLGGGETGAQLLASLRRRSPEWPFAAVLVTGDTDPDRVAALHAGGMPVLRKPLAPARLRALLAELLAGASGRAQRGTSSSRPR